MFLYVSASCSPFSCMTVSIWGQIDVRLPESRTDRRSLRPKRKLVFVLAGADAAGGVAVRLFDFFVAGRSLLTRSFSAGCSSA